MGPWEVVKLVATLRSARAFLQRSAAALEENGPRLRALVESLERPGPASGAPINGARLAKEEATPSCEA